MIDDFVIVNAGDQEDWAVVLAGLLYPLFLRLFSVPSSCFCGVFLGLCNQSQELDVSRREQIPSSVNIDNSLTRPHAFAFDKLVELALLLFHRSTGRGCRVLACGAWPWMVHGIAGGRSP